MSSIWRGQVSRWSSLCFWMQAGAAGEDGDGDREDREDRGGAHGLSRKAPRAASCRPPGTGCSSESKVVGLVMRLTESARTSWAERKPNSTPSMADDVGWDVFMVARARALALQSFTCAGAARRGRCDRGEASK